MSTFSSSSICSTYAGSLVVNFISLYVVELTALLVASILDVVVSEDSLSSLSVEIPIVLGVLGVDDIKTSVVEDPLLEDDEGKETS